MRAEFLVLAGARAGESFPVGERATIGSDPSCDVRLDDAAVARFHAALVRNAEGGYRIAVVEGASEVVVGGVARREALLYHGQKVTIGSVELQLLAAVERSPTETSAEFGQPVADIASPRVEKVWQSEKYKYALWDGKSDETPARRDHRDHVLRGLYLLGHATTERTLARMLERAADAVTTALHPDRIVIALKEPGDPRLVPAVVRRGPGDQKGSRIAVSQRVVGKSIDEGLSVLTRVRHEGEGRERPIASVPLTTRTERVGALYCEKLPGAPDFHDEDLDFLGAAGRIVGLAIERARLESESRSRAAERDRERSRWHAVVEGLRQGVLIVDAAGTVELSNPAARRILGAQLGLDVAGLRDLGGVPFAEIVARAHEPDPLEVVLPGAPEVVLEVRPSPVLDADGSRAGAALLVTDATEERLREARLIQAEKLSALGEMLAGVAHELNNPLATVLGFAEVLKRKATGGDEATALDAILEEAERCRRLVSTLLSFARQRTKEERVPVDLGAIAASVLDLLAHDLRAADIEVTRDLPPLPPVHADRYELQQVFFNLVRNARDAIAGTGRGGQLAVVASREGDRARVEVRDSGPGLPAEAQGILVPRPFFTTKGESGTGLGLSIANGIVRDHGGQILASAAPEGGARFVVELPVAAGPTPAVAPADAGAASIERAVRARRILVVDDEEHVRELLAQICRELGHETVLVTNGSEALAVLDRDAALDAVLSDIRMPQMDGIALHDELERRAHPLLARLVFLSGDLARAETAAFLKRANRPVLPKPFRLAQVCRALEDVLAPA